MNMSSQQRLQDLESHFMDLDKKIKESPEKEAISVLHAMFQETLRNMASSSGYSQDHGDGKSLEDIANLYKHAPEMKGDAENGGLEVGIKAPDFSLPDANKQTVRLSDFRGKNVVLCFYPLDWSPACSDQLSLYQSDLKEFERCNTQLLCISVDNIYSHGAWAAVRELTFPLLSDFHPKGEVAKLYNVWRQTDGFSERALYVIDPSGIIRYKIVSPHLDNIPDIYELLDQVRPPEETNARTKTK
jgi:peroxiredoxin